MQPFPKTARHASIDLGSNTIRLLVASAGSGGLQRHYLRQTGTRLSERLQPGGRLYPAAVDRTWAVLEEFKAEALDHGAEHILVGATMAVREASDGEDFTRRVGSELGLRAVILSGVQEAELTAAGVLTGLSPEPNPAVIFDLGGRSTEFVLSRDGCFEAAVSLGLGAVGLTEAFFKTDPPVPAEIKSGRAEAARILDQGLNGFGGLPGRPIKGFELVGTAGTTTTLAAMALEMSDYDPDRVNGFLLTRRTLEDLFSRMLARPVRSRAEMAGLPPERADIIPAGAAIVMEIMDYFAAPRLIVSDAGLLEGLWLAAAGLRSI